MKRIIVMVLMLTLVLTGCAQSFMNESSESKVTEKAESMKNIASSGVWLSFSEINAMLKSTEGFKIQFESVIQNCKSLKIENLYVHVRSYSDSLFKSDYFPMIEETAGYDYDVFDYIVKTCHENGIKVHAWINPYRVTTSSTDVNALNPESPAYKWMNDENPENDINVICYKGIYLNPAEYEVRELVINGIREIIQKYDVDGIHFDDYFYPTTDEEFDKNSYDKYKSDTQNPLSLADWRRSNVNTLIGGCYTAIKFVNKNILFTVSPMASISKNYDELYADVKAWVESGCIDYIIPQLYFGFDYPIAEFRFNNLIDEWKELMECNRDVGLLIGLATYKIGSDSEQDKAEWQSDTDIIERQVEVCHEDERVGGYILFSYTSLFSTDELNSKQRENLSNYIDSEE